MTAKANVVSEAAPTERLVGKKKKKKELKMVCVRQSAIMMMENYAFV